MSTNYAGSPTATQAPSVPPTPGVVPTVVLAADGDALNAASIAQALKVLADFAAWQMSPRAKASDWASATQLWRDAALHKRFGVDHLGYPMGRLQLWQQNWEVDLSQSGTGTSATTGDGWSFDVVKTGGGTGAVSTRIPNSQFPSSRSTRIEAANNAGDHSCIKKVAPCLFHTNVMLAMEWETKIVSLQNYSYGMGFNTQATFASGGHGPIAQFYNLGGAGNWHIQTDDGTTLNDVDSGVAVSAANTVRFRIEYHGGFVDEAATERVLFFIDGADVSAGGLTANMPSVPGTPTASPLFIMDCAGGTGGAMDVGIVRFACNLWTDAF